MKRIKYFVLSSLAKMIISYLHNGGFVVSGPNDASVIFREGSHTPEVHFPWHLAPDIPEGDDDIPMPPYLQAALILIFALGKDWVMQFLRYYLYNEGAVEADLDSYKQELVTAMTGGSPPIEGEGQPEESKETLH